jgi:hypothetical protein
VSGIDRKRQDFDVLERVLGREEEPPPQTQVIDVGVRSVVQTPTGDDSSASRMRRWHDHDHDRER